MLSKVRVCTPEQLLDMSHEQANPKNAVVSLKIALTIYVCVVLLCKDNVSLLIPALNPSPFLFPFRELLMWGLLTLFVRPTTLIGSFKISDGLNIKAFSF